MSSKRILAAILALASVTAALPVQLSASNAEANVHNVTFMQVDEPPAPDVVEETEEKPIIIDFTNKLSVGVNAILADMPDGDLEGKYEFVKLADGTMCMKVSYSENNEKFSPYRFMLALQNNYRSEAHKYMRITYMTESVAASAITITNNANRADKITLEPNTTASCGKFVRSNAVSIGGSTILTRFINGSHTTLEFSSSELDSAFYVKEIAFFTSQKQAYEHYGDGIPDEILTPYVAMTFGEGGTANVLTGDEWGTNTVNYTDKCIEISYAEKTNHNINYMAKFGFAASVKPTLSWDYRYVKVLYSAQNPVGCEGVDLYFKDDKNGEIILLDENIENTDGKFVMSDIAYLPDIAMDRIMGAADGSGQPMHVSFSTNAKLEGGKYCIKGVYFFKTRADAEAFEVNEGAGSRLTVNGNDISKYVIVVPEGTYSAQTAASSAVSYVKEVFGVTLPVVTDASGERDYEIIIGKSDRAESQAGLDKIAGEDGWNKFVISTANDKLVITARNPFALPDAVETVLLSCMYKGVAKLPETVDISDFTYVGYSSSLTKYGKWDAIENVDAPDIFTEDFDADDGYFAEANAADIWKYTGGSYSANVGDGRAVSYVQAFDANVQLSAKMKYTAENDGDMGLMLRYTAADAYLRAGYDFKNGEWFIEYREGNDFETVRAAAKSANISKNTWYELTFICDGGYAELYVNGEKLLTCEDIAHVTPGKIGVFAEKASVAADDIEAVFMSGLATVMRNVSYTRLPDELFREGGSVMEMNDGSLVFVSHHSMVTFRSADGGMTWERSDAVFPISGYPGFLRLTDGTWITTVKKTVNGQSVVISRTSSDDGKTWVDGGIITVGVYPTDGKGGSVANAGNMNDKITQMASTGRIFYSQNYEVTDRSKPNDGKIVFCEFFYSDDNGKTWTKSETASWEIKGNETEAWFGECKILECADGTLRMYNSWNDYGCIVYSESIDGGKTWGPIVTMPEFVCAKSSMQFCRDPYADNDTTYYLVWVNSEQEAGTSGAASTMTRARLSLAMSTDGKSWSYIGDLWHWQMNYRLGGNNIVAHIVDPFVAATEGAVIVGTGLAEYIPVSGDNSNGHGAQREHIWVIDRDTVGETAKPINKFTDVDMGAPYYAAVTYASENGLFNGVSENEFAPDTVMNRSMFVTVLGRLDNADVSKYTTPTFSDVKAGQWYTSYVEWAAANGIVNGMGNGTYGINGSVTVEQALTILARYNGYKDSDADGAALTDFADSDKISSWAADAVKWAVENGIYEGMNGKLCPNSPASRALVAAMFANYVKVYG